MTHFFSHKKGKSRKFYPEVDSHKFFYCQYLKLLEDVQGYFVKPIIFHFGFLNFETSAAVNYSFFYHFINLAEKTLKVNV